MSSCVSPPCEQVGPFRYCPVRGCGWTEPLPCDVRVNYSQSEDGYQQLWIVECSVHGSVSLHGTGEEAWEAKRSHEVSGRDGGGSESQVAPGLRVSDGTADPSTASELGREGSSD